MEFRIDGPRIDGHKSKMPQLLFDRRSPSVNMCLKKIAAIKFTHTSTFPQSFSKPLSVETPHSTAPLSGPGSQASWPVSAVSGWVSKSSALGKRTSILLLN